MSNNPSLDQLMKQAQKKYSEGLYFDAEKIFETILSKNPKELYALLHLAYIYQFRRDYPKAIEYYSEYLKEKPKEGRIYFLRAENYRLMGNEDLAKKDSETAKTCGYGETEYLEEAQKIQKETYQKVKIESNKKLFSGLIWISGAFILILLLLAIGYDVLNIPYWHKSIGVVVWVVAVIVLFIGISHIVRFLVIRKALKEFKV